MEEINDKVTKLQKKINALEKKISALKEEEYKYNVNDVVMSKDNLLLVTVLDRYKRKGRKCYKVCYNHLPKDEYKWFELEEDMITDKPFDYNEVIFNGYVELLVKHDNLLKYLRKGE